MLTPEKVKEYLELKNINLKCRSCGENQWSIFAESKGKRSDDDYAMLGLVALKLNDHGAVENTRLGGTGLIQLMCSQCGYTEFFNYTFIRTYLIAEGKLNKITSIGNGHKELNDE